MSICLSGSCVMDIFIDADIDESILSSVCDKCNVRICLIFTLENRISSLSDKSRNNFICIFSRNIDEIAEFLNIHRINNDACELYMISCHHQSNILACNLARLLQIDSVHFLQFIPEPARFRDECNVISDTAYDSVGFTSILSHYEFRCCRFPSIMILSISGLSNDWTNHLRLFGVCKENCCISIVGLPLSGHRLVLIGMPVAETIRVATELVEWSLPLNQLNENDSNTVQLSISEVFISVEFEFLLFLSCFNHHLEIVKALQLTRSQINFSIQTYFLVDLSSNKSFAIDSSIRQAVVEMEGKCQLIDGPYYADLSIIRQRDAPIIVNEFCRGICDWPIFQQRIPLLNDIIECQLLNLLANNECSVNSEGPSKLFGIVSLISDDSGVVESSDVLDRCFELNSFTQAFYGKTMVGKSSSEKVLNGKFVNGYRQSVLDPSRAVEPSSVHVTLTNNNMLVLQSEFRMMKNLLAKTTNPFDMKCKCLITSMTSRHSAAVASNELLGVDRDVRGIVIVVDAVSTASFMKSNKIARDLGLTVHEVSSTPFAESECKLGIEALPNDVLGLESYDSKCITFADGVRVDIDQRAKDISYLFRNSAVPVIGVLCGSDRGLPLTDKLGELLGVRCNSSSSSLLRTDKCVMSQKLKADGIQCPKQFSINGSESEDEIICMLNKLNIMSGEDFVVKPKQSLSPGNVLVFNSASHVINHARSIKNCSVIIQERLIGPEYAIDSVSRDGMTKITAVWKLNRKCANGRDLVCFDKFLCDVLSPDFESQNPEWNTASIVAYHRSVLSSLRLTQGPCHMKVIITADRGPILVNLAGRCHGNFGSWIPLVDRCVGYSQLDVCFQFLCSPLSYSSLCNIPPLHMNGAEIFLISLESGVILSLDGVCLLSSLQSYLNHSLSISVGDTLKLTVDSATRAGSVLLCHRNISQISSDMAKIHQWTDIICCIHDENDDLLRAPVVNTDSNRDRFVKVHGSSSSCCCDIKDKEMFEFD